MTGLKITVPGSYWKNAGWATGPALVRKQFVGEAANAFWIDPSDLSTLFQDRAGTIPVTQHGDPVSLALDKSGQGRDMVLHPEATAQPIYMTDGFRRWIDVPAGGDFHIANDIPLTNRTLIAAFRLSAEMEGENAQLIMQGAGESGGGNAYLALDLRRWGGVLASNTHPTGGIELEGSALSDEMDAVVTMRMDVASPYSDLRLDGVLDASHTLEPSDEFSGTKAVTHVFSNEGRDRFAAGRLYGLAYVRAFRTAQDVEAIFADKAGVTL